MYRSTRGGLFKRRYFLRKDNLYAYMLNNPALQVEDPELFEVLKKSNERDQEPQT